MPATRRSLLVAAPVAALAVTAACGSEEEAGASGTSTTSGGTTGAAFPVTIEHALGSATIPSEPQRIVTLGWGAQDVLWALGVQPVGVPTQTYGNLPDGTLPWWEGHFDASATTLTPEDSSGAVPFEAIAALTPDLVLAVYSGITADDYARLEQIAPTVAYPESPWIGTWQEQTRTVGTAVGKAAEAEQLVADTEADLTARGDANPQIDGKTAAFVWGTSENLSVYLPGDTRVDVLEPVGLVTAPYVEQLAETTDTFYVELSKERSPEIVSDVLVGFGDAGDIDSLEALRADPVYATVPAVASGAVAWLSDPAEISALSATVLSLPWVLDRLVPKIAQAADAAGS